MLQMLLCYRELLTYYVKQYILSTNAVMCVQCHSQRCTERGSVSFAEEIFCNYFQSSLRGLVANCSNVLVLYDTGTALCFHAKHSTGLSVIPAVSLSYVPSMINSQTSSCQSATSDACTSEKHSWTTTRAQMELEFQLPTCTNHSKQAAAP